MRLRYFYKSSTASAGNGQLGSYWVNSVTNKCQPFALFRSIFFTPVLLIAAYNNNDEIMFNYWMTIVSVYTSVMRPAAIVEPA